jgi:hypothetical protein
MDILMPLVGYESVDADDMVLAIASVMTTVNSDNDPWLYNNLWKTKDFIEGLMAEKRFD